MAESDSTALLRSNPDNGDALVDSTESVVSRSPRRIAWTIVKGWWRHVVILLTPLVFIFLPYCWTQPNPAGWAAYCIAIIAVYWITEAVPLAVTALLPLVLFPAVGVLSARDTATNYLNDTNMLFVGGLMVAVAIEKWNVHKRIALLVLLLVGSKPKWLLLGFMCTTAFLSMWISNTATSAMMLPIAQAVLLEIKATTTRQNGASEDRGEQPDVRENDQLVAVRYSRRYTGDSSRVEGEEVSLKSDEEESSLPAETTASDDTAADTSSKDANSEALQRTSPPSPTSVQHSGFHRLTKGLMLGIAYSANIGGTATLTGTGPNLVLSGDVTSLFPDSPGISFGLWFVFATPTMIVCLALSWMYLAVLFCDDSLEWFKRKLFKRSGSSFSYSAARNVIKRQYTALGPWRFAEIAVLCCFIMLALLWLFREPKFIPGWGSVFSSDESGRSYFSDSSTALFVVFLLFIIPSQVCCSVKQKKFKCGILSMGYPTLLDWDSVQHKLPWNVVILLGSGFAIADGADKSGLSCWIGEQLLGLQQLPHPLIVFIVTVMVAVVTEVISNVATTTLFLPVLASLAVSLSINPLYVMIPAAVAASYAFMLPVATPPNAIAFSYGYLKVYDMVLTGILMNIMCILIVNLSINTLAVPIFDLRTLPNWSNSSSFGGRTCNISIS